MNAETDHTSKPRGETRRVRGLRSWQTVRRLVIGLASLVTLIALFYAEEDWRGRRAWEQCRRKVEAAGVVLDWAAHIPPPVPDAQNFFKAPGINASDWVGRGQSALSKAIMDVRQGGGHQTNGLLVAELSIVPPGTDKALRLGDTNAPRQVRKLVEDAVGGTFAGAAGSTFIAYPFAAIHPAKVMLAASEIPTTNTIAGLFPKPFDHLLIEPAGDRGFRVALLPPPESAADFLARGRALEPDLASLRQALERPYARMDGDYSQPYAVPIPRFITMRVVAQFLADRALSHLLLHDPAEAVRNLTLLHDLCRVLEARPTGEPMTLVAAMINVAITGLYAQTLAEGLRSHAWSEPQLAALQEQTAHTELLPILVTSFENERCASVTTLEKSAPDAIFKLSQSISGAKDTWWARLHDPLYCFMEFAPRGWLYQNLVVGFTLQPFSEIADPTNSLISVEKATRAADEIKALHKWSPYSWLNRIYRPNFTKAWQTVARNQTQVNEASVACALERYRLAHGDYPEQLVALSPQFMAKIPHDIIGGQPLRYRRGQDGTFVLYSVGWNQTDDGGQTSESPDAGDWVWPNKVRTE